MDLSPPLNDPFIIPIYFNGFNGSDKRISNRIGVIAVLAFVSNS